MQVKGLGFKAAVALLEPLVGSESSLATKKEPVEAPVASSEVLQPLAKDTWRKFAVPCPWLEERVPDVAVRERYGVFCYNNPARRSAYSGRVMLPVRDIEGQLFGYLGRSVSPSTGREEPKYLFPRNLPKSLFLFGAYELSQGLQAGRQDERCSAGQRLKVVYLLESPFAVMRFASLGLPAISPFGWSVSTHQIELLRGLTRGVVYLPDYNKRQDAGVHLAELAQNLWLRFPPLPAGCEDPEQLDREQVLAL
jgi:DNA primase